MLAVTRAKLGHTIHTVLGPGSWALISMRRVRGEAEKTVRVLFLQTLINHGTEARLDRQALRQQRNSDMISLQRLGDHSGGVCRVAQQREARTGGTSRSYALMKALNSCSILL